MNNVPQDYMCVGDTVHCDTESVHEIQLFQLWELAYLLMEATVAVGSTTEEKYEQKSLCRVPTLTWSSDRYWNGMQKLNFVLAISFVDCLCVHVNDLTL